MKNRKTYNIDGELKLEELADGIINVSTPLHGVHNGLEVVIQQNDIFP